MSSARWLTRNSMMRKSASSCLKNGSSLKMDSISSRLLPTAKMIPPVSRYFSTRDEEISRCVVLLQETDVRSHVRVNLAEVSLIDKFDDVHAFPLASKR